MKTNNSHIIYSNEFNKTFRDTLDYIKNNIKSPTACLALCNDVKNAIETRFEFADSYTYKTIKFDGDTINLYHIKVNNFYIFYTIDIINNEKYMKLRYFAYGRMNIDDLFDN